MFKFLRNYQTVVQTAPLYILNSVSESCSSSSFSSTLGKISLFNLRHFKSYVSLCSIPLMENYIKFLCACLLICHPLCTFKMLLFSLLFTFFQSFVYFFIGLFVFLVLSFESSLCILDTYPLSDIEFSKNFPQSLTCLFILLTVSFEEQNFKISMKFISSFCSFIDLVYNVRSKKSLPDPRSQKYSSSVFF